MNEYISSENELTTRRIAQKLVTKQELYKFFGLMIANRSIGNKQGEEMWNMDNSDGTKLSACISTFDPNKYMTLTRFREIKRAAHWMYADDTRKHKEDPWWEIASAFDLFNKNRQETIATSNIIVMDESISAF